jgi:putative MATE family efflux protein
MSAHESTSTPAGPPSGSWLQTLRAALGGAQHDYTRGSLSRAIVLLAIPMVLEMAMESLFAIVDVFFVSRLGDAAVAAVGLTESMITLVYAFAVGFSMAVTALVARRIGEKNPEGASRAAKQAVILGLGCGVASGIPLAIYAADLLALMGADPEVIEIGSGYTSVLLGTNAVIFLIFMNNAIFRGAGDAAIAMRALWLANGINIVLDPCLIFGLGPFPELGVTGAGVATAIGRGTGVLYQLWALSRGAGRVRIARPFVHVEWPTLKEILRLSVGGVAQFLIATASWVALMRIVAPFGKSAVAGYTIAIRIVVFTILPAWGLCNAAATLVGQNLGARQPERAEQSVWLTGWYNAGFLCLVMAVFLAFGPGLIAIFTDDPATAEHGVHALRIMSYGYFFYAWGMVLLQAFNGAGDTMTPTRINFVCYWLIQVPGAYALARGLGLGPNGVFWSVAAAESLMALVSVVVFRQGRWKETKIAPDVEEAPSEAALPPLAPPAGILETAGSAIPALESDVDRPA